MDPKDFDLFVEDLLDEESIRTIIIIGASQVDVLLYEILSKYLLLPRKKNEDLLLKGDNPLATFSSRIRILYRLGFISDDFRFILDQIRQLRNVCAHHVKFDFYEQSLKDRFKNITDKIKPRKSFELTKKRYFEGQTNHEVDLLKCSLVTVCVILLSIQRTIVKTSGNTDTLDISNK